MLHPHFFTLPILAFFLTAGEHLCRLKHVLDLPSIDVDTSKSVEVLSCHYTIRS